MGRFFGPASKIWPGWTLVPQSPMAPPSTTAAEDCCLVDLLGRRKDKLVRLTMFIGTAKAINLLVLAVVVCFCIQLSLIRDTPTALYQACGILGATVMPHSLYLGSGTVQPRLYDFNSKAGLLPPTPTSSPTTPASSTTDGSNSNAPKGGSGDKKMYMPSLEAIRFCLKYSIAELVICLFAFALFVNSAILIVAGASLYRVPGAPTLEPDLFGIHRRPAPIAPSIVIAGVVGRDGLDTALSGSQVALNIVLPFVTAPLIYFTSARKHMTVIPGMARCGASRAAAVAGDEEADGGGHDSRSSYRR
ncbi:hypothetical protein B0T24DRAFT_646306 [Lasiosphaeria ovina]|uniref:Uncharacterized protein n=1 Tax=Lasiosphaeria ovina TaxID=92902 RepID=A0AAE0NML4_9PEZI|nr:hypothetical protein B0T24DRAFT_646306 [Lasiosphaeria ovina]